MSPLRKTALPKHTKAGVFLGALLIILLFAPEIPAARGTADPDTEQVEPERSHAADLRMKLPYPAGMSYPVIQGIGGSFSHSGYSFYAWDFAMPLGSPVCAVADGMVVCIKQDSVEGGTHPSLRQKANMVVLDHGNGIYTEYLHLQANSVKVREGEIVRGGQVIALSGNTGYSSRPHLHFQVQNGLGESLRATFLDVAGDGIPKEGHIYTSANDGSGVSKFAGPSPFPLTAFAINGVILHSTDMPGKLMRLGSTYSISGTAPPTSREVVLFVMPEQGGVPLLEKRARVQDSKFELSFTLDGLRARVARWNTDGTQSNLFHMAIVPARADGTYWSEFSYPISVR